MFSKLFNNKQRTTSTGNVNLSPKGLGGWLIIVGFGLILGIALHVYGLFDYVTIFSNINSINFSGFLVVSGIECALGIIIFIIEMYLLYLFFKKSKNFPNYYIIFLWSLIAWTIIDYFMLSSLSAPTPELQKIIRDTSYESSRAIVKTFISSIIWIIYMHKSKRVKATFIR
ncbi:MAG TPA: DUF2569 domain-containing protein [Candidatus Acidoferrales bacterium]|nr:DUF2569 domain-containing protein [Candidatus Acidoferrales bacterium]